MSHNLNVRAKTIQFLEKKMQEKIFVTLVEKIVLRYDTKITINKRRIDKLDLIKTLNFSAEKHH